MLGPIAWRGQVANEDVGCTACFIDWEMEYRLNLRALFVEW